MNRSIFAQAAAALGGVAIIAIGVRFLLAPEVAAGGFGVAADPAGSPGAYFAAKGVRDIVSGVMVLSFLALRHLKSLGIALCVSALTPTADAFIVMHFGGSLASALGIHAATAVVLLAAGLALIGAKSPPAAA